MKYVKYFVVVAVLLIAVWILSGGESEEDVLNEMPEALYPMCEKGDFRNFGDMWMRLENM